MGGSQSSTINLDGVCQKLKAGEFKNVVVMCGAGISTSAGVPDFRSPSMGLYFKLKKYNLPYPEAIFEGSYFRRDPKPFYALVREIFPNELVPTPTHRFFALLHKKGYLRRVYTQNIDGLEFAGGLPEEKVVEAHGTFHRCHCTVCRKTFSLPWLQSEIFHPERNDGVPKCDCGGVVRPDVVLFGEAMPSRFFDLCNEDLRQCDLLLIFGTSLAVAPFNGLFAKVGRDCPRVFINRTKPGSLGMVSRILGLGQRVDLSEATDLIELGDCDEKVEAICSKTGWTEDLEKIPINSIKM